ncbi:MAG: hypothetical protein FWE54_00885 [Methanimicrococcus sp.]|nr:hypothetical protein [Methanimicrococcus sp.]
MPVIESIIKVSLLYLTVHKRLLIQEQDTEIYRFENKTQRNFGKTNKNKKFLTQGKQGIRNFGLRKNMTPKILAQDKHDTENFGSRQTRHRKFATGQTGHKTNEPQKFFASRKTDPKNQRK